MRIHLIAIGGAVMHNLAIVLSRMGNKVTGSDDAINDPAKTNLANEGLLPENLGFFAENISSDIDVVILGMHARSENPELLEAQKLGLKIVSFPEYIFEISKNKKRIVVAGSHGKTTVTSMIMHVLKACGMDFDYMVGAKLRGFDTSVKLTESAPVIILEGDEYLASPLQRESKFMFYKPHTALITGIAWDHINVFPVYSDYVNQFLKFANSIESNGTLVWCAEDKELQHISTEFKSDLKVKSYSVPPHKIVNGTTFVSAKNGEVALEIFGKHNLMNMEGARLVCEDLGISTAQFYDAIKTFEGAANRLQLLYKSETKIVYKDFAHSPSKVKATVAAVREQFPDKTLICVLELHTFSSLNEDFLPQYEGALNAADVPLMFLDKHAFELKKMPMLNEQKVKEGFKNQAIEILHTKEELSQKLQLLPKQNVCFLFMSSGTFSGLDLGEIAK
ncbi:MAG: Mur ligase family protein [Chitinophagales bacterium]|nr:peptidoglycan synthetase [Chitinophagales bacterium]MCO5281131.1 Mur ligase family protein [Chitinophagales bacterium]OJV31228.1 MAG: peptidoglycan synthetase [Bacteroidetes bacterium 37-13]HRN94558.1 Mur ligase family protein [Chitinophagales bacterium]HRP40468.1 Mur ligase family protein [Chitinophagales bacterium]